MICRIKIIKSTPEETLENKKKKFWFLFAVLGMIPGAMLWVILYQVGFAGEYAGIIIGLGGVLAMHYTGAKFTVPKLLSGIPVLALLAALSNHFGYMIELHNDFAEGWYGKAGAEFTFGDASRVIIDDFLKKDMEGMRMIYLEAAIAGFLLALLFWAAFWFYYRKSDEIEQEKTGKEKENGQG